MAAKEEASILKYLKKNPGQDALEISFGTDIDESVVKETLVVLAGKEAVEAKDVDGRQAWTLAAPKAKAPAPAPAPKAPRASEDDPAPAKVDVDFGDEDAPKAGGVSKGFVLVVALVVLLAACGASFVLGGMQASSATKALAEGEVKAVRDSIGLVKLGLNSRIDALESQIRELKASSAKAAETAPVAAKPTKAAKPVRKKKK